MGNNHDMEKQPPSPAPTYRSTFPSQAKMTSTEFQNEQFRTVEEPFDTIHPHYVNPVPGAPSHCPKPQCPRRSRAFSLVHCALTIAVLALLVSTATLALGIRILQIINTGPLPTTFPQPRLSPPLASEAGQPINIIVNGGGVTPTAPFPSFTPLISPPDTDPYPGGDTNRVTSDSGPGLSP
ncbi:hypothetical protein GQ43DRAFT_442714 [Delitschia confertaspora ATCC 74209]|uniref:Uncharacterized protein n=1 Tax=Delitschia confertaspora ATCC 74209 TaxID=1513339 RepID=A0A9P4JGW0_9PLEO|nr:hypothetical protein GQ43DRAFT_442714 [Delitschia confertaspora ATCC 74209]